MLIQLHDQQSPIMASPPPKHIRFFFSTPQCLISFSLATSGRTRDLLAYIDAIMFSVCCLCAPAEPADHTKTAPNGVEGEREKSNLPFNASCWNVGSCIEPLF